MSGVRTKDGTLIAYDRLGSGPVVTLVGGGLADGTVRLGDYEGATSWAS